MQSHSPESHKIHLIFLVMCSVESGEGQLAVASFNDTRCDGETVCPDTSLLFTCTVTGSVAGFISVIIPSGERVNIDGFNDIAIYEKEGLYQR